MRLLFRACDLFFLGGLFGPGFEGFGVAEILAGFVQLFAVGAVLHGGADFLQYCDLVRLGRFNSVNEGFCGLIVAAEVQLELSLGHHEVCVNRFLRVCLVDETVEALAGLAKIGGDAGLREGEDIPQKTFSACGIGLRGANDFVGGSSFFPIAVNIRFLC